MTLSCDATSARWPGHPEVLTKFDIEAFVTPKTPQDVLALLDEAIQEARYLGQLFDDAFTRCERNAGKGHQPGTA